MFHSELRFVYVSKLRLLFFFMHRQTCVFLLKLCLHIVNISTISHNRIGFPVAITGYPWFPSSAFDFLLQLYPSFLPTSFYFLYAIISIFSFNFLLQLYPPFLPTSFYFLLQLYLSLPATAFYFIVQLYSSVYPLFPENAFYFLLQLYSSFPSNAANLPQSKLHHQHISSVCTLTCKPTSACDVKNK